MQATTHHFMGDLEIVKYHLSSLSNISYFLDSTEKVVCIRIWETDDYSNIQYPCKELFKICKTQSPDVMWHHCVQLRVSVSSKSLISNLNAVIFRRCEENICLDKLRNYWSFNHGLKNIRLKKRDNIHDTKNVV